MFIAFRMLGTRSSILALLRQTHLVRFMLGNLGQLTVAALTG